MGGRRRLVEDEIKSEQRRIEGRKEIKSEPQNRRISNPPPADCKHRMSKGGILSIVLKKTERSDSILRHSLFVIRYSAVRFSTPSTIYPQPSTLHLKPYPSFLAAPNATTYATTAKPAICGIPQLIAIWAAIMADRTEAQPLTDQA